MVAQHGPALRVGEARVQGVGKGRQLVESGWVESDEVPESRSTSFAATAPRIAGASAAGGDVATVHGPVSAAACIQPSKTCR